MMRLWPKSIVLPRASRLIHSSAVIFINGGLMFQYIFKILK